ncbi:MAG: ECF-type sigma factor [Thermoanaerobaculia bacterium]|nr:ECF-type sigma factor [Thermoanaerobaculia bacterium]
MNLSEEPVTQWLQEAASGDAQAAGRIAGWAYAELEGLAASRLRRYFGTTDVTLEPAALVSETFLKLLRHPTVFENRRHFFAFVGKVMLRVLIDYRRARASEKRGGDRIRVSLTEVRGSAAPAIDVLAFEQALERLESLDVRKAEVTRLRVLWGLSMDEIADVLEVSLPTVGRDWRFARTWLAEELKL